MLLQDPHFNDPRHACRPVLIFASRLQRASRTAEVLAEALGQDPNDVIHDWRLNEQMYGALTGLNKRQAMTDFGFAQVQRWRRGWAEAPPAKLSGAQWAFTATRSGCNHGNRALACDIEEAE
jgi:bisphosphoglycerate-dependent phosphoglycerate mutase